MILKKMTQFLKIFFFILLILPQNHSYSDSTNFNVWLKEFSQLAKKEGVSDSTINNTLLNSKFLPKVIEYDRYQPEFYEDTHTYINKRVTKSKIKKGITLYKKEKNTINIVEKKFSVEKELLLSLMGIETNFGKYLGKMDIVSSLATLSFDKRRSAFFTNELLILLKLIDKKIIDPNILYGSWAGAFGNFQFMPSTIKFHAIDFNKNSIIELKKVEDSFASAANYISKIGWNNNEPCFYKIDLDNKIPDKYLNASAKKIKNKKKYSFFKKYIKNSESLKINNDLTSAIVTPDISIIPGAKKLKPAYIVFNNYELILKWNRSLRFALAVCTLKNRLKNEI